MTMFCGWWSFSWSSIFFWKQEHSWAMRSTSFDPFAVTFERAGRSKGRSLVYLGLYWSRWWVTNRAQFKNSSHFTFTLFKGRMEVRAVPVHERPHSLSYLLLKFVRVSYLCAALNNSQKVGGKITQEFFHDLRKIEKWKSKSFHLLYFEFIHLANHKVLLHNIVLNSIFQIPNNVIFQNSESNSEMSKTSKHLSRAAN